MGIWYVYEQVTNEGAVKPYSGACPPYYDLKGTLWYDILNSNIPAIRDTVMQLLTNEHVNTEEYFVTSLVEKGKWESTAFLVWNIPKKQLKTKGKELFQYFRDIPGLVSLSISVLKPGTHIKPHNGDTDGIYRIHVPILIPKGLPDCGIQVAGIKRPWTENEAVVFCDAHLHEAWNYSDRQRVILIVDVVRPELLPETRIICARVLSFLAMVKVLGLKMTTKIMSSKLLLPMGRMLLWVMRPLLMLLQRRTAGF